MAGENNNNELTLESVAAQVADLNQKIDSQNGIINDQAAAIAQLKKENAALKKVPDASKPAEKPKIPDTPVEYNGEKYQWTVPVFRYDNQMVTAVDASTDNAIIAALVEKGSGFLKKVEE